MEGRTFYILGSKLVHILVHTQKQISYYPENFSLAKQIAHCFFDYLKRNEKVSEHSWHQFTQHMIDHSYTATFEFLQVEHQHVELFDFDKPKFKFIAFTSNKDLLSLSTDVQDGVMKAREAGLGRNTQYIHFFCSFLIPCLYPKRPWRSPYMILLNRKLSLKLFVNPTVKKEVCYTILTEMAK